MTDRAGRLLNLTPVLLTGLRLGLAPVVMILAFYAPRPGAFAVCLITAFFSDIFDGIIARRLNVATPTIRRLDSAADTAFYVACVFAAWRLYPLALTQRLAPLVALIVLEVLRYILDFVRFRREASYHMWSSKLWGVSLFVGFISLLVLGKSGAALTVSVYLGIVADLEGISISLILPRWQSEVPSLVHALRARRHSPA